MNDLAPLARRPAPPRRGGARARRALPAAGLLLLLLGRLHGAEDGTEFFEKKIRPLLAAKCFDCHHPENKIKGGLRLDSREGWMAGGELGAVVVPGKPEESLLIKAVRYHEPKLQMPPKRKLSEAEIADLETWVKLGAPDPRTGPAPAGARKGIDLEAGRQFWSFRPIANPPPPAVRDAAWPRSDIDRFILARQEAAGLKPGADASPEVLIRRLTFSLTGLPPTPEEVAEFVRDCSLSPQRRHSPAGAKGSPAGAKGSGGEREEKAIERLVDRLLASPHFGERWGRHWLDVARFAESSGGGRTLLFKDAWRYRDYVIESFNADVPFDQFIREQIAGDLLPARDDAQRRRQLIGTGFLALGPTNYEEQDKKQLRFDVIDEQLDTLGKALLGMTIGCARCHDHKFDPIPTRDYYALAGIFASTRTLFNYTDNVARWVDVPLPMTGDKETALRSHEEKVAALKAELAAAKAESQRALGSVAQATDKTVGKPVASATLGGIVVDDLDAKVVGNWRRSKFSRSYIGEGYLEDQDRDKGMKTLTFVPPLPKSGRYEVRLAYSPLENRSENTPVTIFHADGEQTIRVNQRETPLIGGRFVSLGQFRFEKDGAGYVLISNEGTSGHVVADAVQFVPVEELTQDPVATAVAENKDVQRANATVRDLEKQLKQLTAEGPKRPLAMAVREGEGDEIGDTEVRVRGLVHNVGAKVPRGFLQVATTGKTPAFSPQESGRRELAEWLVSPENPLTARVLVNRAWHWLFGAGLVRTTENFGTTGETPSHPELLDHLARRFTAEGWSMKRLVREIVLSRTWQLAAGPAPASDPDNRLLARYPRRRLDAEQIRDTILAVSGQLDLKVGGPNIGGAGEIDANTTAAQNTEYTYVFADTRRSVYTPAFRARRLELFEAFDFANINQTIGERNTSTVAPQALYLLNSPFVIEQAKAAAARALAETVSDEARLERACRLALGRAPLPAEHETFLRFLRESGGDSSDDAKRAEAWAYIFQTLFASLDFRYLN